MFPYEIRKKISLELLQRLAEPWDIGVILDGQRSPSGLANVTFYVESDKGKYVLKQYSEHRTRLSLDAEIAVIWRLSDKNLPVARPLLNKWGDTFSIVDLDGKRCYEVLFPLMPGEEIELLAFSQVVSMGRALGNLQSGLKGFVADGLKRFDLRTELGILDRLFRDKLSEPWPYPEVVNGVAFRKSCERYFVGAGKLINEFRDELEKRVVCHGDFHPENVKFEGDVVSAVFDFEGILQAPRLYDVTFCLQHFIYRHKKEEGAYAKLCKSFLYGYEEITPLSSRERLMVPWFTEYWLWKELLRLHFYFSDIPGHREHQANNLRLVLAGIRELQELR
jgi:homoserine kinase type II